VKTVEQQTLAGLHRLRSGWMATRTARLNTLRGLLRELGLAIPTGARQVVPHVEVWLGEEGVIAPALRPALAACVEEVRALEVRIREIEQQLEEISRRSGVITRLRTIPGIGVLTATARVAFVGDTRRFATGRHLASYLGLTPREHSSGSTRRLGRITKRGDPYLRMLLIHGARSVLHHAKRSAKPDRLRTWALGRERALGHNKAAVALANKLARIAWAVAQREEGYVAGPAR
jgi:transposase